MKNNPLRFIMYLLIGVIIYQVIDSGETTVTHGEVKNTLIISILVVFALLLVVRSIKKRYEDRDE